MSRPRSIQEDQFDVVIERICSAFDVTPHELTTRTRVARIAWPRQVAYYVLREHARWTFEAIGIRFKRTNASVHHGRDHVRDVIEVSRDDRRMVEYVAEPLAVLESHESRAIRDIEDAIERIEVAIAAGEELKRNLEARVRRLRVTREARSEVA